MEHGHCKLKLKIATFYINFCVLFSSFFFFLSLYIGDLIQMYSASVLQFWKHL
jgi:hypothetical protein